MTKLTKRQAECLAIMHSYFKKNDQFPPVATVAERMEVNPNSVQGMMVILEREKMLSKNEAGKWKRGRLYPYAL